MSHSITPHVQGLQKSKNLIHFDSFELATDNHVFIQIKQQKEKPILKFMLVLQGLEELYWLVILTLN